VRTSIGSVGRPIVFYDEDCGFCRWSADRLRAWDRHDRLRFAPIQGPDGDRLLADMDPVVRYGSWHVVSEDAGVRSAGAAIPLVLRRLPAGAPLAALAAAFPKATERTYRFTVQHRARLGRLLGQRACAVDPSHVHHG
jgi:predicted DCC family thiol-disulfide oxidoreductase YuxK